MESVSRTDDFKSIKNDIILVCPKCLNTIPLLKWVIINAKVNISIDCNKCSNPPMLLDNYLDIIRRQQLQTSSHYCTKKDTHHLHPSDKYCIDCKKWVCQQCIKSHETYTDLNFHTMIPIEILINTTCPIYSLKQKFYCRDCKQCVCKKCINQHHSKHNWTEEKYIRGAYGDFNPQSSFPYLDSMMKGYALKAKTIIHSLNDKIAMLEQLRRDLETAFNCYKKNNDSLKALATILHHNYELLKQYPTYNMYSNTQDNFLICSIFPFITGQLVEKNAFVLAHHFNSTSLYERRKPIEKIVTLGVSQPIAALFKSETSNTIVSGGERGLIHFWHSTTMTMFSSVRPKLFSVNAILFDYSIGLVIGSDVGELLFYRLFFRRKTRSIQAHQASITSLIPLAGKKIASGSHDKTIKIWDVMGYACVYVFQAGSRVLCLTVIDSTTFASGFGDHTIKLWNATQNQQFGVLKGHTNTITCLETVTDIRLASGSQDYTVRVWNTTTFTQIGVFYFTCFIKALSYLNSHTVLCCTNNSLSRINVNTMKFVTHSKTLDLKDINAFLNLGDGSLMISSENCIQVWSF